MEKTNETKEHRQLDLWQTTIHAGLAIQQAAEVAKAPVATVAAPKQADEQRQP